MSPRESTHAVTQHSGDQGRERSHILVAGKSCVQGNEVGVGANPAQCPLCAGLQALGQTFGANPAFASSLRYLDLSKNPGLLATDEANVSA